MASTRARMASMFPSKPSSMHRAMQAAISSMSASFRPRVVTAGVPRRTPLVIKGLRCLPGDSVLIGGDVHLVQAALQLLAGELAVRQVDAASGGCPCRRTPASRPGPAGPWPGPGRCSPPAGRYSLKAGCKRLAQAHGLGGDDVHQRAALGAGENGLVDGLGVLLLAEDQAAPGAAEGLVGSGGDHVGVGHGVLVEPGSHQAGDVGHIHHELGARRRRQSPGSLAKSMARG